MVEKKVEKDALLDACLLEIKDFYRDGKFFKLYNQLEKFEFGKILTKDSKIFEAQAIYIFNSKTRATHDKKYFLEKLKAEEKGLEVDIKKQNRKLNDIFDKFNKNYEDTLRAYIKDNDGLSKLKQDIQGSFSKSKENLKLLLDQHGILNWEGVYDQIPRLLALLFAYWTLANSSFFKEMIDQSEEEKNLYLLKPHPAQVITMLRILNASEVCYNGELKNHLAEIKTGEGKSVFLGILSTFFALLDFNVYVACYSQYLSERDKKSFSNIFNDMQVDKKIEYGTFNQLTESNLRKKSKMDIRESIENYFKNKKLLKPNNDNIECLGNIVLIDEVDVFFSKDFYGNIYPPIVKIEDPTISHLIDSIWKNYKNFNSINVNQFLGSPEYKAVLNAFPHIQEIIKIAVTNLFQDLKNSGDHQYILKDGKIGYAEQDNVIFNVTYGYNTLFAYFKENEKGNIAKEILDKMKYLRIRCGNFSYTKLLNYFDYVLGVTGTLSVLNGEENRILREDFEIDHKTLSPSIYGQKKLNFSSSRCFTVCDEDDYLMKIAEGIKRGIHVENKGDIRAVLVFFENKKDLEQFNKSDFFKDYKSKANIITEETSKDEKDRLIKYATCSGSVTLLTRILGRGTDFYSNDETVNNNWGIHVIQTFFSEIESEEVQIKGRTARQGQDGSYELILLDRELEKFGVKMEKSELENLTYDELCKKREDYSIKKFKLDNIGIKDADKKHEESMKFLTNLGKCDEYQVVKYLKTENEDTKLELLFGGQRASKTILLMDATCSMSDLINNCKILIGKMFDRIKFVLNDCKVSCIFEIQLAVYRNYNVPVNDILQYSTWESNTDNLRTFLNKIEVDGGLGNEAVEIGLHHLANEMRNGKKVSQAILIGDMPANTKEEVTRKRNNYSRYNWKTSKYKDVKYYKEECKNLINYGLKVHTFYLTQTAKSCFEEISRDTGGNSKELNLDSNEFVENIEKMILNNIAVVSNIDSNQLINTYNKHFKGYC